MANQTSSDYQLDLALRLLDDDQAALEEVLCAFGPAIAAVLRRKYEIFNEEDVEDVLSIALHRLWQARHRYDDGQAKLRTFFYRIVENVARDVFKYGWHKARQLEVDAGTENDLDALEDPVDPPDVKETATARKKAGKAEKDLKRIIDGLSPSHRHIIVSDACAKDGVASSEKLADELGIAVASVPVYRKRALETIRRELRDSGHDIP